MRRRGLPIGTEARPAHPQRQQLGSTFRPEWRLDKTARDIAQLYVRRWKIELWFRDIKTMACLSAVKPNRYKTDDLEWIFFG